MDSNDPKERLWQVIRKRYTHLSINEENEVLEVDGYITPLSPFFNFFKVIQNSKEFTRLPPLFDTTENFPISDMYVELAVAKSLEIADPLRLTRGLSLADEQEARHSQNRARRICLNECVNNTQHNNIVILGDPGSGKTSLLKYLCLQIARGENKRWVFPLFISLRKYWQEKKDNPDLTLLRFVATSLAAVGHSNPTSDRPTPSCPDDSTKTLNPEASINSIEKVLVDISTSEKKHVLFLLDGLDEIASNNFAIETVTKDIKLLGLQFSWVITSRYTGFYASLDDDIRYEVVSLHHEAITSLVTNWFVFTKQVNALKKTKLILKQIRNNPRLMDMARNPFLLTLLCYVQNYNDLTLLPIQRNEIYGEIISLIQKQLRAKKRDNKLFGKAEFQYLAKFCYYLYTNVENAPLQLFELDHWDHCALPDLAPSFESHFLTSRLLNSWKKQGDYHFVHLTFQEYFIAQHLYILDEKSINAYLFNPQWRIIYRFLAGIQGHHKNLKSLKKLLNALLNPVDKMKLLYVEAATLLIEAEIENSTPLLGYDIREKLWYIWCNDKSHLKNGAGDTLALLSPDYVIKNHLNILSKKKEDIRLKKSIQLLGLTNSDEADELLLTLYQIPLQKYSSTIIKALADKNTAEIRKKIIERFLQNRNKQFWAFCKFAKTSKHEIFMSHLTPYLLNRPKNLEKYAVLFKAIKAINMKAIDTNLLDFINHYHPHELTDELLECLISLQTNKVKKWVDNIFKKVSTRKKTKQKILLFATAYNVLPTQRIINLLQNQNIKTQKKYIKAISLQQRNGILLSKEIIQSIANITFSNSPNREAAFEALLNINPVGLTHGQIATKYKYYYREFLNSNDNYIASNAIRLLADTGDIQSFNIIIKQAKSTKHAMAIRIESIRALEKYQKLDISLIIETLHSIYKSENHLKDRFLASIALETLAKIDISEVSNYLQEPSNRDVFTKICTTNNILLFDDYYYDKSGVQHFWQQTEKEFQLLDPLKEAHEQLDELKIVCQHLLDNKHAKKTGRLKKKPLPLFNKTQFTNSERINSIDVNTGNRLLKGMYINPDKAKILLEWIQYKFPWVFIQNKK